MNPFTVYPAIDLRAGKVVRLVQGDPDKQTTYHSDPAFIARQWVAAGATWLHIVNLDGAFEEADARNKAALQAILHALEGTGASLQFGGGLRTLADIESALALGIKRVILGTAAVSAPQVLTEALAQFGPDRVAVALDVAGKVVRLRGWKTDSDLDALTLCHRLVDAGVITIIYTDISRDGMGVGLNLPVANQIREASGLSLIISGGVHTLEDVRQVRLAGLSGVIIGRALYDGNVNLQEALKC